MPETQKNIADFRFYFEKELSLFVDEKYEKKSLLNDAVRYALEGQGKRVRPLIVFLVNQSLGGKKEDALSAAIAMEMIHTYSLVHDDMPILDNDSLRRGRKTVHVVFDEQTALLAGNSLLTDAFGLLSGGKSDLSPLQKTKMISELSQASGSHGMLLGQMLDVYWTKKSDYTKSDLDLIHLNKTGKLIGASCALGALSVSSFNLDKVNKLRRVGELIGHSFQIIDDLLDDSSASGKSQGKDKEQGKLTYLELYPKEECKEASRKMTEKAFSLLKELPLENSLFLEEFFINLLRRSK